MKRIHVWAPKANRVQLKIDKNLLDMDPTERGWWTRKTPLAQSGVDYAFILDKGQSLPDPRSAWQPEGVHGPSRILDHGSFSWNDRQWQPPPLCSAVIYELHVGTFSHEGTFEGVLNRLDHLLDLGITHVELMPVNGFSGSRGWGYDGVNLYAPHEAYGGPEGLKRLVDACHGHGLAVILDVVYNHLGPEGNYLESFGPYFTDRYSSPWGKAINFDGPESDEVRRFFCDNALMWLRDYHVDGLRIDAVHAIMDMSAVHILEQLALEVAAHKAKIGRHVVLIAESALNDPRLIRPREVGGYGLDAQWNDDFHHALHTVLTGEKNGYYCDFGTLPDLAKSLKKAFVYDGSYSRFRRRRHGRPTDGLSGHCFVAFLQNHDQVGNRARGDRLSHIVSPGRLKIGAALVFVSPFIPMLFQGEEWGAMTPFPFFTDHGDPKLGEAVRKGRQEEFSAFGWKPEDIPDPQSPFTFIQSKLIWDELFREPHDSILSWYQRLIRLRRSVPELLDGRTDHVRVTFDEKSRWLIVERKVIVIICNLSQNDSEIPVEDNVERSIILASEDDITVEPSKVFLPPESVVILGPEDFERRQS